MFLYSVCVVRKTNKTKVNMKKRQSLKSELLDALKRCLYHIEVGEGQRATDFECVHAARKAIAKATKKN
jgi:hypothetical protein